jgi:hypothetical protein
MYKLFAGALMCALTLSLGCDVDVKDEGKMPDVDVQPGRLPDVEVRGPDVDVHMEDKKVTVPDVDISTRETTVPVPDVDVTIPREDDNK